jgi:hypothetical protein
LLFEDKELNGNVKVPERVWLILGVFRKQFTLRIDD